ncbi:MAG: hypothetical protein ACI9R3_002881 [Verrucomicrobiales bacterium]|jgi:hypothetical protein
MIRGLAGGSVEPVENFGIPADLGEICRNSSLELSLNHFTDTGSKPPSSATLDSIAAAQSW